MVEISEEKIEVEQDVVEVEGTLEHVETMKDKIVGFGKKHKKSLIAAGAVVLCAGAVVVKALCFPGEVDDFEDASGDAECDVF